MVSIRSRSSWGARAPRSTTRTTWGARRGFTVHYSAGPPSQTPRQIQDFHMDGNGWSDVGYNFLVDDDGTAYEGRGWTVVGAHAAPHNTTHIGVCFIGRNGDVTGAAKATIRALYDEACERAGRTLAKTYHGGLSGNSTSCPGANLAAWVRDGMPATGGATGGDDMVGLSHGDSGERVKYLQVILMKSGFDLPKYGADGDYGDETEAAVLAARRSQGSAQGFGDRITGWAAAQIMCAFAQKQGGK